LSMSQREGWRMVWGRLRAASHWAALRDGLQTSLWFIPVAYTSTGAGLAVGLLRLDSALAAKDGVYTQGKNAWFLYGGEADGARELLSTIASSLLTIAGLVFSITILVLQLASSQFSPRVLRTFLRDRVTQRAMGMFLGSFVYAMVVLPQVRSGTDHTPQFVPGVSVYAAFGLVLLSVAFFVRYIHHMAHSIRAVNIIERVAGETRAAIERLYPEPLLEEPQRERSLPRAACDRLITHDGPGGVVISVEEEALLSAALEHDLVIAVVPRVGDFVPRGSALCRIWGKIEENQLKPREWVVLASERTPQQDAIFGFRQLVDIAERALSPGINDPTTATQTLDQLHDLLRMLAAREIPSPIRVDASGAVRLSLPRPDFADYVRLAFEEIRTYGAGSIQVVRRSRAALRDLLGCVGDDRKAALYDELSRLDRAALHSLPGISQS
jgi:uncharacterized membrane protein